MDVQILNKGGNDLVSTPSPPTADVPEPRTREGETRRDTWERIRKEARAAGRSRRDAYDYATRETDRLYANGMAEAPVPFDQVEAPVQIELPAVQEPPPAAAADGLAGLSELPDTWPPLPANAALAVEVAWVQANRLRVVHGGAVDLSRSLSPAPSYAALAWLETSVLFPAKWADVTVKASQDAQDEQQDVRRERVALAEIRELLAEVAAAAAAAAT